MTYTALPLIVVALAVFYLLRRIDPRIVAIPSQTSFAVAGWIGTYVTHE